MRITIILCTYNRCKSLAKTLESLMSSDLPSSSLWNVLIVDNNSSDRTREVSEQFCRCHPNRLQYMFVSQQGKSYALNAAISESEADILAFTDDDVVVEPTWLRNLTAPLETPGWAGTAGPIRLARDFACPYWLAMKGAFSLGECLVQFDEGDKVGKLTRAPFGANMAFRRIMFEKYGNFRTDLGRRGKSLIGNEDTEFGERLMAAGESLCYIPSAVVHHPVPPERLTKRYFRAYWFSHGRSVTRQSVEQIPLRSIPFRYLRQLKANLRRMFEIDRRWLLNSQSRFYFELLMRHIAGEIFETLSARFGIQDSSVHI